MPLTVEIESFTRGNVTTELESNLYLLFFSSEKPLSSQACLTIKLPEAIAAKYVSIDRYKKCASFEVYICHFCFQHRNIHKLTLSS